jgi:hypothetical protein
MVGAILVIAQTRANTRFAPTADGNWTKNLSKPKSGVSNWSAISSEV